MAYAEIPTEILEEIFLHLDHESLWRCLGVSSRWRSVANTNRLWKIQCNNLGIEQPSHFAISEDLTDLCLWASTYVVIHLMPAVNWRTGKCKVFEISANDTEFVDIWEDDRGAVYYYKQDKLVIYEVVLDEVKCSEFSCFKAIPRELYAISIGLSKCYVAISNCNMVIIYKNTIDVYEPYRFITYRNDKPCIIDYKEECITSMFSYDVSLQVKTVLNEYVWLTSDYIERIYIINMQTGEIVEHHELSYFRYSLHNPYVANWDENGIKLFDNSGRIIFHSDIKCWDLCFNKDVIVIGNKNSQRVETWEIKNFELLMSKSVLYQTDIVIHPRRNLLVLAEKSKVIHRISCIDAITGNLIWQVYPPAHKKRCHDLKIISNYVFIWHSFMSRPKYSLLDLSDGDLISEGLLPDNKCHFSDSLWVYLDNDHFKIKSYLGFFK